jgi:hypothetical protein
LKWQTGLIVALIAVLAGCESQGIVLLRQADQAVQGGDYDGALLNVQMFLKRYPTSEDTVRAKQLQQQAGVGKREQTAESIKEQLKAGETEVARGLVDEVRALDFLPGNERVVMNLDSLLRQVEHQLAALQKTNQRMETQLDSLTKLTADSLLPGMPHVPTAAEIDSLVNQSMRAAMQAMPKPPKTIK